MEKGKIKKTKKHISIALIPHSSSEVKVMRFSALYSKLIFIFSSVLFVLLCVALYIIYLLHSNSSLKANFTITSDLNTSLNTTLAAKNEEIASLKEKDTVKSDLIKKFEDKYKDMTDTYITGHSSNVRINRSGNRVDRTFASDINKLKGLLDTLNKIDVPKQSEMKSLTETDKTLKKYIDSLPNNWPTSGSISSDFGERIDPISGSRSFHDGIDIAAPYGQIITAAGTGIVSSASWTIAYGYTIIIDHGHGITSFYGHTSKILVKEGEKVQKGDVIARVGSTGRSTGNHLHFGVFVDGTAIDPLKCLN